MNTYLHEEGLVRYIKKLKSGCTYGVDGILSEHLKYSADCEILINQLCVMFTLCLKFGIVPDSFTHGILIPLLKKPTCDPTVPNNYRLVVVSTTFSKILEIYVLEECGYHDFDDSQFGFVPGRGTNMAISVTRDVISYCVKRGSPIFACSLDAFDAIPHSVLFDKCIDILSDVCWRLLYFWYRKLTVQIRWNNVLSSRIRVERGTRQGGLSSPFLFNIFYQDMMVELSNTI